MRVPRALPACSGSCSRPRLVASVLTVIALVMMEERPLGGPSAR